jgi:ABC-type oligopeptide transport system ATPase subunit
MTVEEIISEGLKTRGLKDRAKLREEVAGILNKVGLLPEHGTRYPHEFSGGQRQRIGIARALVVKPSFIIADEPVSALDVSIQAQVINLLMDIKKEMDLTILFIAHNLAVVKYFSDRIGVMYFGNMVELADADELYAHPIHPYTKSLLSAIPQPDPVSERDKQRLYYDPSIHNYEKEKPSFREIRPGHFVYASDSEMEQYQKELES